jgi:hypothetical protein
MVFDFYSMYAHLVLPSAFLACSIFVLNHSSSQEGTDCRITVLLLHIVSIFPNPQGMEIDE